MDEVFFLLLLAIIPVVAIVIIVLVIIVIRQLIKARASAISKRSFEMLASELREENAKIMAELAVVKEMLGSVKARGAD
jgi:uncharacterized membrane protein YqiK